MTEPTGLELACSKLAHKSSEMSKQKIQKSFMAMTLNPFTTEVRD